MGLSPAQEHLRFTHMKVRPFKSNGLDPLPAHSRREQLVQQGPVLGKLVHDGLDPPQNSRLLQRAGGGMFRLKAACGMEALTLSDYGIDSDCFPQGPLAAAGSTGHNGMK